MEVTQQLHNFEFRSQGEFEDLLQKSKFSLQEYIDLYDLVYNIDYPVNFRKIYSQISPNIQAIASQIESGHPSISYGLLFSAIDDAMTNHPEFLPDLDDIPF